MAQPWPRTGLRASALHETGRCIGEGKYCIAGNMVMIYHSVYVGSDVCGEESSRGIVFCTTDRKLARYGLFWQKHGMVRGGVLVGRGGTTNRPLPRSILPLASPLIYSSAHQQLTISASVYHLD